MATDYERIISEAIEDCGTIQEAVNEVKIVSPRYGEDFKSIPMLSVELQDSIDVAAAAGAGANGWTDLLIQTADGSTQRAKNELFQSQINRKAEATYVDAQDALKADKSYVYAQDASLQSQIDQKASAAYLDSALAGQTQMVNDALSQLSTAATKFYPTLAGANADIANLAVNQPVQVGESGANGGLWYKATSGATTLTKSPYDPLTQANNYTDDKTKAIEEDQGTPIYKLADAVGNIVAYFDENSVLNVANSINVGGKSLEQIISDNSDSQTSVNMTMQTMLTNTTPQLKELTPIRTKADAGTVQRMPMGIKTDYGLLCFFHSGIAGYDGDNQGSELWKAIVDIDSVFNVSVRSTELFLAPDEPRGIVKHPMLGRTQDGRIILIFEKRLETTDQYTQYICYSSDEGLTFTTPAIVSVSGFITGTVLGSTGTILTLPSGRLVCPMYTKTNRQCGAWYSDDDGATWNQSSLTVNQQIGEPTITLESNRILMSTRVNSVRKRYFFESKDNGESWAKLPLEIDGADCEGSIFYDSDIGVTMLSYVSATDGTRTKYRFGLSHTKSKSYDLVYKPVPDSYYIGYSQILKLDDGIYALVHEYADIFVSVNNNENSGILILSAKEVFNHVSRN